MHTQAGGLAARLFSPIGTRVFVLSIAAATMLADPARSADEAESTAGATSIATTLSAKLEQMERRIRTLEAQHAPLDGTAAAEASSPPSAGDNPAKSRKKTEHRRPIDQSAGGATPDRAPAAPRDLTGRTAAANKPNAILGLADSPVTGLSIGAYGEIKFGAQQNPAANGQWQNGFDAHRLVLLPTFLITPNIIFNAEIEFEHAGSGFDPDDKLHGTAEIEQVWIDFKIADQFNWRSPGIDLVPIGYINQHHEPTTFYSVKRPELYNGLIPSTWMAPATSLYGRLAEGLTYTVQASSSLEDFGGDFSTRTDANAVPPFPAGYMAGIDGQNALGFARPVRGDFRQLSNDIAIAGQLGYSPPAVPGFNASVSTYYAPNTTPRGAYADTTGLPLGRSSLAMFDAEFRYRVPSTPWEARGEYVFVSFGNPANLRANNDTDPTNNVGKTMSGYSGEVAYHLPLGHILASDWEMVPFYRYTFQNTQAGGFAGSDLNLPTGSGRTQFHNAGIALFPSPQLVLKATWQRVINRDPAGARSDSVLGGVGFFF